MMAEIFAPEKLEAPIEIEGPGGITIEMPAGATPDAMKRAIENVRSTPEFANLVDKQTGAPARVRTLVGSAPLQDKLANLKRFYPDAVPYGEDNFVFTDPASGRPTLYNPEGFDVGDVAGFAREGFQAAGATLGATFGALGGFVVGTPTGPGVLATMGGGAVLGAGMGTAVTGQLFDLTMNLLSGRIDSRGPAARSVDAAGEFMAGAAGQRVGEMVGPFLKKTVSGTKDFAKHLVDKFTRLGIEPPAGATTGSRAIGIVEQGLRSSPASAGVMQKQAERVIEQTAKAADDVARSFGTPQTRAGAGEAIKTAAARAVDVFEATQERAYSEAFDLVGKDTNVGVAAVAELRKQMQRELARAPVSLKGTLEPAIKMLLGIEDDAARGLPFDAFRQIRTGVGRDIRSPVVGSSGAQNEALKRVYAALTQDMSAIAREAGSEAGKRLAVADRYTRIFMNTSAKTLEKIVKLDADERAFDFVTRLSRDGAQQLSRLRRHFTDGEWDDIAATTLKRMGLSKPGAQNPGGDAFSVNTFLTNWSRMTPEAKQIMFGGRRYSELAPYLDDLVEVVSSLKGVEALTNSSNTAQTMIAFSLIQTVGTALGGAVAGGPGAVGAATATLAGQTVAPWAAAKLITSPAFVKWLVTPVTNANGIGAHLGRLTAIATEDETLREPVLQLLNALRPVGKAP